MYKYRVWFTLIGVEKEVLSRVESCARTVGRARTCDKLFRLTADI